MVNMQVAVAEETGATSACEVQEASNIVEARRGVVKRDEGGVEQAQKFLCVVMEGKVGGSVIFNSQ